MLPHLPLACRVILWLAERIVPAPQRGEWRREWYGELWHWIAGRSRILSDPGANSALLRHASGAIHDAIFLRLDNDEFQEQWRALRASPRFCLLCCLAALTLLAVTSRGFETSRHLMGGLPYLQPERLVLISQKGAFMGQRSGFWEWQVEVLREHCRSMQSIASYVWQSTAFTTARGTREFPSVTASTDFFAVLGVEPALGQAPEPSSFLVSDDFWKQELEGDPHTVGSIYQVGNQRLRLAGVLPAGFSFLSASPSIWIAAKPYSRWSTDPPQRRGIIARMRPNLTQADADSDLQQAGKRIWTKRLWAPVEITSVQALSYRAIRFYGSAYVVCLLAALAWSVFHCIRTVRRGVRKTTALRFWGFLALKSVLLLSAIVLIVLEHTGATALGTAGNVLWTNELVSWWVFVFGVGATFRWAWVDQQARCQVCLQRLSLPVRIGIPGQMLLDQTGIELMCAQGHGARYEAESVLGDQLSGRWMGLDDSCIEQQLAADH